MEGLSAPLPSSEPFKGSQSTQGAQQHCGPVRADGAKLPTATLSARTRGLPASMWEVAQKVAPWAAATALLTGAGVVALRAHQGNQRARQQAVQALESQVAHLEQQVASEQGKQAGSVFVLNQCRLKLAEAKQQLRQADTQVARLCDQVCGLVQQLSAAEAAAAAAQAAAKASAAKAARASAAAATAKKAKRLALCAKHAAATQAQADVAAAEQRAEAAQQWSVAAQAEAAAANAAQAAAEQRAEAAQQRAVAAEAEAAAASAAKLAAEQAGVTAITLMHCTLDEMAQQLEVAVARAATADSVAASNAAAAVEVAGQLGAALQQAAAEREALQQEVGALQAQVGQLEADLLQQHAATAAAQGRADATATSVAANEAAMADVQQRLGAAFAALQSSNEEVADLSARLQQQQKAILAAQAAREEAAREGKAAAARAVAAEGQLHEELQAWEAACVGFIASQDDLKLKLGKAKARAADAEAGAAATAAQAAAKVAAAEQQAATVKEEWAARLAAVEVEAAARLAAQQQQYEAGWLTAGATHSDEVEALCQAQHLTAQLEEVRAALQAQQQQVGAHRSQRDAALAQAADEKAARVNAEKAKAAAVAEAQAAKAAQAAAQAEIVVLRRALAALQPTAAAAVPGVTGVTEQEVPAAANQQRQNSKGRQAEAPDLGDSSSGTGSCKPNEPRHTGGSTSGTNAAPSPAADAAPVTVQGATAPVAAAAAPAAAPTCHASVAAAGSSAQGAAVVGAVVSKGADSEAQQQEATPAQKQAADAIDVEGVAADMAEAISRVRQLAATVLDAVVIGNTATAEEACTEALQLFHRSITVATGKAGQEQLRAALCQLLQEVAAVTERLHPATADLLLRQAAALAPGGQLPAASTSVAARVAERLGWFGKAAALLAAAPQPGNPSRELSEMIQEHQEQMKRSQVVVVNAVELLASRPPFEEYNEVEGVRRQVRLLRASYPHSQLLLLLDALLCVQLQQGRYLVAVVRSLPTCSPQLAAALSAAGGAVNTIAGQSSSFWLAWLGWQCAMVAERADPQRCNIQLCTAIDLFRAAPAAGAGDEVAAAAATAAAHSEYVALFGALYPTTGALEVAKTGLGQLLEEEEAAHALMNAMGASADARAVEVVPLHPYWAAHVYYAQGMAFQLQGQPVLAVRSFALAAGLSRAARPAFAAVALCHVWQVLVTKGHYQQAPAQQVLVASDEVWPYPLVPATLTWLEQEQQAAEDRAGPPQALYSNKEGRKAFLLALHPDQASIQSPCVFSSEVAPLLPGWEARWEHKLLGDNVWTARNFLYTLLQPL